MAEDRSVERCILSHNEMVKKSKFLSYILRHHPESIGLVLDPSGWADVYSLVRCAGKHGKKISIPEIKEIVRKNDKKRFELSEDGRRIRALQGHSISVDTGFVTVRPPEHLYHGSAKQFIASIKKKGLLKRKRLYVHLSGDEQTAHKVGKRHGEPVILKIDAVKMYEAGYVFFVSSNGVWLTEHVPPEYIQF